MKIIKNTIMKWQSTTIQHYTAKSKKKQSKITTNSSNKSIQIKTNFTQTELTSTEQIQ